MLLLSLYGCAIAGFDHPGTGERPCSVTGDADILVLGDSIMAWFADRCQSIPDVVGSTLGRPVRNRSVSGALLSAPEARDIRDQIPDDGSSFEWVMLDGGANDINVECECQIEGSCDDNLDQLASEDGTTGEMPEFLDVLTEQGFKVMLVGYYPMPSKAQLGFGSCQDELRTLAGRYDKAARKRDSVWYADAGRVVSVVDDDAFYVDNVHPSVTGAARVGKYVAGLFEEIDPEEASDTAD